MFIEIHPSSGVPLFRQIVDQVQVAVATGVLQAGDALPSVRALSKELVVNPTTVQRAYGELEHAGITETRRGQGTFVSAAPTQFSSADCDARVSEKLAVAVAEAARVRMREARLRELFEDELGRVNRPQDDASEEEQ